MKTSFFFFPFRLACLFLLSYIPLARAESVEETARGHYEAGAGAYAARQFEEARSRYGEAYALVQKPEYLLALAHAELRTGSAAVAATHFASYLRDNPDVSADSRQEAEIDFAAARAKVAEVTLDCDTDGAEVFVDGVSLGRTPLSHSVFLSPGVRRLEARKAEGRAEKTLEANPGTRVSVRLDLRAHSPVASASDTGAADFTPREPSFGDTQASQSSFFGWFSEHPSAWLLAGLAVGGATVGTVVAFSAKSHFARANTVRSEILSNAPPGASGVCVNPSDERFAAACSDFVHARDSAETQRNLAIGSFAVAGAAALGFAVYYFVDSGPDEAGSALAPRFSPYAGPDGAGARVIGRF